MIKARAAANSKDYSFLKSLGIEYRQSSSTGNSWHYPLPKPFPHQPSRLARFTLPLNQDFLSLLFWKQG